MKIIDSLNYEVVNPFTKKQEVVTGSRIRIWKNLYGFEVEEVKETSKKATQSKELKSVKEPAKKQETEA